jgi:hypothetical protein
MVCRFEQPPTRDQTIKRTLLGFWMRAYCARRKQATQVRKAAMRLKRMVAITATAGALGICIMLFSDNAQAGVVPQSDATDRAQEADRSWPLWSTTFPLAPQHASSVRKHRVLMKR